MSDWRWPPRVAFHGQSSYFGLVGFVSLQEELRRELRRRIAAGELTGMELARKTRFTQAHISNFINGKRGLKLAALDRMMKALGLSIYDLLDPRQMAKYAALPTGAGEEFVEVPVVKAEAASSPVILHGQTLEVLRFRHDFLEGLRTARVPSDRRNWTRFILLQIEPGEAEAMWPHAEGRATVLVDRHQATLLPHRDGGRRIFAVRNNSGILVRYAEETGDSLLLQPRNPAFPAILLPATETSDTIIGRVVQVSLKS